ncbi:MAG: hypothetical protein R2778_18285 [Saprospiraceae bacterium]
MKTTLSVLLSCSFLLNLQTAFATHIVGGEITYRCLGNDNYEISLTVYRELFQWPAGI